MSECLYYDTKDIMTVLKVGKRKANEIMHMFDQRGQLFRLGKTMRVRKKYFDDWLNQMDGHESRRKTIEMQMQRVSAQRR